ncbi:MAG: lipopolysaccharide heptosyltransferase II [Candidatus Omnitrophota bacterium]
MKRILVVNVNWLGDTLFAGPFIKALKSGYPAASVAVLTHPRCREILEGNPCVDEIIAYDEKKEHASLSARLSLIFKLRKKGFDAVFILRPSFSRSLILFLSGIPERIGYENKKSGFLLTRKIPLPAKEPHKADYFLNMAKSMGIDAADTNYELRVSGEDAEKADKILRGSGVREGEGFAVINAGGNWDLKRWPFENFARLGDEIVDRFGLRVVLTGAKKDIELAGRIKGLMRNAPVALCGATDLKTLAAIFKKARCVISNDSGPMHIAAAVKTPVVALFGPTSAFMTGPRGAGVSRVLWKDVGCEIPCYKLSCLDNKCMKAISVSDVIEALTGILS